MKKERKEPTPFNTRKRNKSYTSCATCFTEKLFEEKDFINFHREKYRLFGLKETVNITNIFTNKSYFPYPQIKINIKTYMKI